MSFYTLFSLAPLLLALVPVASLAVGRQAAEHGMAQQLRTPFGAQAAGPRRVCSPRPTAKHKEFRPLPAAPATVSSAMQHFPRGAWYYNAEEDVGYVGSLRTLATVVADDPAFGDAYGGIPTRAGNRVRGHSARRTAPALARHPEQTAIAFAV